jgi:hypothetical protein
MSDDRSFEIGGREFKLNKIDAMKQFHVARRIGPILAELVPAMKGISKVNSDSMTEEQKLEEFARIATPFMAGISKLSDADSDYVLYRLLSAVEVKQPASNSWARIAVIGPDGNAMLMMQDLELPMLLQAAGRALMYNLSGFFASLRR